MRISDAEWEKNRIIIPGAKDRVTIQADFNGWMEAIRYYLEHLWAEDGVLADPPEISFLGLTMRLDLKKKLYVFEENGRGERSELPPGQYNLRKKLYAYASSPGEVHNALMRFMSCDAWPELDIACRNGLFHHVNFLKLPKGCLGIWWQLVAPIPQIPKASSEDFSDEKRLEGVPEHLRTFLDH